MDDATARALNALNLAFYRQHADDFSAKRERPWPGWTRLLDHLPDTPLRVLDLGCGNGRFGRFLAARRRIAHYTGVDASEPLLDIARAGPPAAGRVDWVAGDLVEAPERARDRAIAAQGTAAAGYDLVALFGVLHGVPGERRRRTLLEAAARALAPGGLLVFTCWDFAADPRIAGRLLPREAWADLQPPIDADGLGPADHLLPWGDASGAVRYVAAVDAAERARLLRGLPVAMLARFVDDGPERSLNHYTVAAAPDA